VVVRYHDTTVTSTLLVPYGGAAVEPRYVYRGIPPNTTAYIHRAYSTTAPTAQRRRRSAVPYESSLAGKTQPCVTDHTRTRGRLRHSKPLTHLSCQLLMGHFMLTDRRFGMLAANDGILVRK